jgi:glycosyltransferase involved in cell wall biosynthesis
LKNYSNKLIRKTALIFYGGFLRTSGGAFSHVRNFGGGLEKLGWDVEVITLDSLPLWCRYLPHIVERMVNLFYTPFGFSSKEYITKLLYRTFFNKQADIYVFEDIYLSWNTKYPAITILHAVWSDNLQALSISKKRTESFKKYEAKIINNISHPVLTVSYPYKKFLIENHFIEYPLKKINVVELGIDQSTFSGYKNSRENKKSIVYCGSLEARKNVSFLLDVYNLLSKIDSEYKLTIIGWGPEKKQLMDFSKNKNLDVKFLGRLSRDQVMAELHRHSIYVHPSIKESFSYSLLEAKLAGLNTFAHSGLEVPSVFIDVPMSLFEAEKWCAAILDANHETKKFKKDQYTFEKMVLSTLEYFPSFEQNTEI